MQMKAGKFSEEIGILLDYVRFMFKDFMKSNATSPIIRIRGPIDHNSTINMFAEYGLFLFTKIPPITI